MKKKNVLISLSLVVATAITSVVPVVVISNVTKTSVKYFTVSFDSNGGTPIDSIKVAKGKKIKQPKDPLLNGYHLLYWLNNQKVWFFEENVVDRDLTLNAKWDITNYTISYDLNGGSTEEQLPTTYNILSDFDLARPQKALSHFGGWFNENGNRIDRINPGMTGDLLLTAKWVDNLHAISLDESRGNILVYLHEDNPNYVTLENNPVGNKYHVFKGWFDKKGNCLSTEYTYDFEIQPDSEKNYIYSKYMDDNEENQWKIEHAIIPQVENDNIVKYGIYPQSNVNDKNLLKKLNQKAIQTKYNDYYYFNHEYYSRKAASLYRNEDGVLISIHNFDNGEEILDGDEYWFRVEPIKWRLLEESNNEKFLVSVKALDLCQFNNTYTTEYDELNEPIFPNDYSHSLIRRWLNIEFYNAAFQFENGYIISSLVDNTSSTTRFPNYLPNFETTKDNVFLLSYKDYTNAAYGFDSKNSATQTREAIATDYTRARGGSYQTLSNGRYSNILWTRSAHYDPNKMISATKITIDGVINQSDVKTRSISHQPAMRIKLDK